MDDAQFRALAETSPDAIVAADRTGRLSFVNAAAERLFGHPAAALVGEPVTVLMPPEFRAAHTGGFARFIETGRARLVGTAVEVEAQASDGRRFPIELSLGATGSGPTRTLTAVIRDLTARRRRERHLAAQLAVTSVLAEPRPAAETEPRLVEELTRALGWEVGALWTRDEDDGSLRARHVWTAEPDRCAAFAAATYALVLGPGEGFAGRTLALGAPVWLDDMAGEPTFARRDAARSAGLRAGIWLPLVTDGHALGIIELFTAEALPVDEVLRDLLMTVASQVAEHLHRRATQERLADELARSNAELERFAQTAAHDLRAPLQTVSGFAELLERRHGDELPADAREALALIRDSAQGGSRLLDHLLAYARAGGSAVEPRPVDPRAVLDDVLVALRGDVEARGAVVRVAGALPEVVADPVQLAQVLQNLIANALAYTPADRAPLVVVSGTALGPDCVRLSVRDHGRGIDPADATRLFEPFVRGAGGGTGLGLAVCARIVARHGGHIWVDPTPGGGSTFSFTLRR